MGLLQPSWYSTAAVAIAATRPCLAQEYKMAKAAPAEKPEA
jgi:hypothetical protein